MSECIWARNNLLIIAQILPSEHVQEPVDVSFFKSLLYFSDLEMTLNSIISLILVLPSEQIQEPVLQFCEAVAKSYTGDKRANTRIKL